MRLTMTEDCTMVDFEDPVTHKLCCGFDQGDLIQLTSDSGASIWLRASDAARLARWLIGRFADQDWRPLEVRQNDGLRLHQAAERDGKAWLP